MELVFEAEGPVVRDRVTKKKVKFYDRQYIRFILIGEKIDRHDIPPDITSIWTVFLVQSYISSDEGHSQVLWLLYNPDTKNPIYAETGLTHFGKLEVK